MKYTLNQYCIIYTTYLYQLVRVIITQSEAHTNTMWNIDHEYVTLSVSLSALTLPSSPASASDKTSVKTIIVSNLSLTQIFTKILCLFHKMYKNKCWVVASCCYYIPHKITKAIIYIKNCKRNKTLCQYQKQKVVSNY